MIESEEDLHKVVPDGIFRDRSSVSLGLLDDAREVSSATVLHEDVEDAGVAVDVAVVIAYYVFVVEVFEDVSTDVVSATSTGAWDEGRTLRRRFASCRVLSCAQS